MYLDVPSSATTPTDVQLMFNFAAGTTTPRSWNIKIALLPCGASYLGTKSLHYLFIKFCIFFFGPPSLPMDAHSTLNLSILICIAPTDCLQYFTAASGRVKSFNWQDVAASQQLNNQNYNMCFRTELVSGQVGNHFSFRIKLL